jgi:hypothetical protein
MLLQEDIIVGTDWVVIPLRTDGTYITISEVRVNPILYVIGDEVSTSLGVKYSTEDYVKSPESIKVRAMENRGNLSSVVTIVRDGS